MLDKEGKQSHHTASGLLGGVVQRNQGMAARARGFAVQGFGGSGGLRCDKAREHQVFVCCFHTHTLVVPTLSVTYCVEPGR